MKPTARPRQSARSAERNGNSCRLLLVRYDPAARRQAPGGGRIASDDRTLGSFCFPALNNGTPIATCQTKSCTEPTCCWHTGLWAGSTNIERAS